MLISAASTTAVSGPSEPWHAFSANYYRQRGSDGGDCVDKVCLSGCG